jgi:AcrR family transcriptional regulator
MDAGGGTMTTKERILVAAVELFGEQGYRGTSIRDIARRVGIKESSLYNHYSGKDGLLEAILEYYRASFESSIPPPETMDAILRGYDDPVALWLAVAKALMSNAPPLQGAIARVLLNEMYWDARCRAFVLGSMFEGQKRITRCLLEALSERGLIRNCDVGAVAERYVYFMHGLDMEMRLLELEGRSLGERLERMAEKIAGFISDLAVDAKDERAR